MRSNNNYQTIVDEQDIVHNWLSGNKTPSSIVVEDDNFINIYNNWCQNYDIDDIIEPTIADSSDKYIQQCTDIDNWNMPSEYKSIDMLAFFEDKCNTAEQTSRVHMEMREFTKRGMLPVLQFLKYLVDTCENHNVVLGVGRGSSVASYCLYLLGVHRIDSIKYELDIKEFLK